MKILWIEDNPQQVRFLVWEFEKNNVKIEFMRSIKDMNKYISKTLVYDAYISDLDLREEGNLDTERNGQKVIAEIKKLKIDKPIIVCTNFDKEVARKYGMTDEFYIRKDKNIARDFYNKIMDYINNYYQ